MIKYDDIFKQEKAEKARAAMRATLEGTIDRKLNYWYEDGSRELHSVWLDYGAWDGRVCREVARAYRRAGWWCQWDGSRNVPVFYFRPSRFRTFIARVRDWFKGRRPGVGDIVP